MVTIEEMLQSVQEEIERNNYGDAIINIYNTYTYDESDQFLYFLLDCWFDNMIENPLKDLTAEDLGVSHISENAIKKLFRDNKQDIKEEGSGITFKYNWVVLNNVSTLWDRSLILQIGLSAYFQGFPVYYCKDKGYFSDERIGFLILDKGVTFDQFKSDIAELDHAGALDYTGNRNAWKELK